MSKKTPDFLRNASNVYRTEHFIVKQRVGVLYSTTDYNVLFSRDIYYARTAQRDAEYEAAFSAQGVKINMLRLRKPVGFTVEVDPSLRSDRIRYNPHEGGSG